MYGKALTLGGSTVPAGLAFTGSNSLWMAVAGVSLIVAGATVVRLGRSVRQTAQVN